MDKTEIITTASKLAAYAVKRRKSPVTVETPVVTHDDIRAALAQLVPPKPQLPELSQRLQAELDRVEQKPKEREVAPDESSAPANSREGIACIPCTVSHVAACAGQLNEAIRFAREDLSSSDVGERIDRCLSEIAAAERIDLAPENVAALPDQEREIANDTAKRLRKLRHTLEWYESYDELETAAAEMSRLQHDASQAWRQARLSRLSPEQTQELLESARAAAQKIVNEEAAESDLTSETP